MGRVDVAPGFPTGLEPYMKHHAEVLLKEKKISAIPDWTKALRTDFMQKARASS
jgi:NitT/TauT family transport system substrate-binding protein